MLLFCSVLHDEMSFICLSAGKAISLWLESARFIAEDGRVHWTSLADDGGRGERAVRTFGGCDGGHTCWSRSFFFAIFFGGWKYCSGHGHQPRALLPRNYPHPSSTLSTTPDNNWRGKRSGVVTKHNMLMLILTWCVYSSLNVDAHSLNQANFSIFSNNGRYGVINSCDNSWMKSSCSACYPCVRCVIFTFMPTNIYRD